MMSLDSPVVSAIIPTSDRPSLFEEALRSAATQTWPNREIVVIDDSGNGANRLANREAIERARSQYHLPIRYLSAGYHRADGEEPPCSPLSARPGAVRNRAVDAAKGELLAFLDDDDLWSPEKMSEQVALHIGSDTPISHTAERWWRRGAIIGQPKSTHAKSGMMFSSCLKKCVIGPSTVMMTRSLFEKMRGFRNDLALAEDYELWIRIADRYPVAYLNKPMTLKRSGDWPQLSQNGPIEYFRIAALRPLVEQSLLHPCHQELARQELIRKCHIYANGAMKRGNCERADQYRQVARQHESIIERGQLSRGERLE